MRLCELPLWLKVWAKWFCDKRRLPLVSSQKELYFNIHSRCWSELKVFPDLVNCRDFNDKIQWLKLFDQSAEMIRCCDKIGVREFVRERVGAKYLVELYQVRRHFSQLNFENLPRSFVIKVNHDSGTVIPVRDKHAFDGEAVEARVECALAVRYGWETGEWAYSFISPRVLAEEFILPEESRLPPDYKFHCVDGRVRLLQYIYDRGLNTKEEMIDRSGEPVGFVLDHRFKRGNQFCKDELWVEMIEVAESLAYGFKYVRVDLYKAGKRVIVGELTFWPMYGCYKGDGQLKLGEFLDFDRTTCRPPIVSELRRAMSVQDANGENPHYSSTVGGEPGEVRGCGSEPQC